MTIYYDDKRNKLIVVSFNAAEGILILDYGNEFEGIVLFSRGPQEMLDHLGLIFIGEL